MTIPSFTLRQLLEAGVHFGHHTRRWNPKMAPYIFGVRNNIHIMNLEETVPLLSQALSAIREVAASGGRILFVGTKKSCSDVIAEAAQSCGQYYVNHRWLGGMMTNFSTVSNSINRLKELDVRLASEEINALSKKEILKMTRDREKLNNSLGGIRDMGGLPDMLFVIDTIKDSIAIEEAKTLNIPVVAVLDSNSNPDGIDYPIPGNDDALRAVSLYCNLISESIIDGLQAELLKQNKEVDLVEKLPSETEVNVANNNKIKLDSENESNNEPDQLSNNNDLKPDDKNKNEGSSEKLSKKEIPLDDQKIKSKKSPDKTLVKDNTLKKEKATDKKPSDEKPAKKVKKSTNKNTSDNKTKK